MDLSPVYDVSLVLKNDQRLRVHSLFLRVASPVFAAMFGPHFREGRILSEETPGELPFPDDDPESMKLLCKLLHHQISESELPSIDGLLEFAVLVDKYDCRRAVFRTANAWLEEHFARAQEDDEQLDAKFLAIAASLRLTNMFAVISKEMMLRQKGSFWRFSHVNDFLPPATLIAMTEVTHKLKSALRDTVEKEIDRLLEVDGGFDAFSTSQRCRQHCAERIKRTVTWTHCEAEKSLLEQLRYYAGAPRGSHKTGFLEECFRLWGAHPQFHPCEECRTDFYKRISNVMQDIVHFLEDELGCGLCFNCIEDYPKCVETSRECPHAN